MAWGDRSCVPFATPPPKCNVAMLDSGQSLLERYHTPWCMLPGPWRLGASRASSRSLPCGCARTRAASGARLQHHATCHARILPGSVHACGYACSLEKQLDCFQANLACAGPEARSLLAHAQAVAIDPADPALQGHADVGEGEEADDGPPQPSANTAMGEGAAGSSGAGAGGGGAAVCGAGGLGSVAEGEEGGEEAEAAEAVSVAAAPAARETQVPGQPLAGGGS